MNRAASPSGFYEAGLTILGVQGQTGLTIAGLCDSLDVTKGSFYHHFESMKGYVAGLMGYWETEYTDEVARLSENATDPENRLGSLQALVAAYPHAAERSIRGWAIANSSVAEVVNRVDQRRIDYLASVLDQLISDPERSQLLARTAVAVLVGAQQLDPPPTDVELLAMFGELELVLFPLSAPSSDPGASS